MKLFLLTIILLFSFFFLSGTPLNAASGNATTGLVVMSNYSSKASGKELRRQKKKEKRLNRFQQKLEKKIAKWKQKGKFDASIDLNIVSLIVLALGGLFILLGLAIPYIGLLFVVIGALIGFVGLVMLLLLDGVRVTASDSAH